MIRLFSIICICTLSLANVSAQKVLLTKHGEDKFIYNYQVQENDTWYKLAKLANTEVEALKELNQNAFLSPDQFIHLPIQKEFIITEAGLIRNTAAYTEVYYRVAPKDNLFRISRRYFYQPMAELMAKNHLDKIELDIEQELLVGWLANDLLKLKPSSSIISEQQVKSDTSQIEKLTVISPDELLEISLVKNDKNDTLVKLDSTQLVLFDSVLIDSSLLVGLDSFAIDSMAVDSIPTVKRRGIGLWDGSFPKGQKLYVLHSQAKINSEIVLTNPMLKKSIKATVLDRIPKNIYPNDVAILVSPKVADELGVRDKRFRIEMEFEQEME